MTAPQGTAYSRWPVDAYVPFRSGPFRLAMGLMPLDAQEWIQPDAQMAADLQEKARLLCQRHQEVFAALPVAHHSAQEVLDLLLAYLPVRFPELYRRVGAHFDNLATGQRWHLRQHGLHPLDLAGRLVQEDLCLMRQDDSTNLYRLVAASVCFPTRWRLTEKLGQSLAAIHGPVPGYAEQLTSSMDRFFARLKTERPVWRLNWTLIDDPALFQPTGHGQRQHNAFITPASAGDTVWLRMERQTLRRLTDSGALLFTIRVYVRPLQVLARHPEHAAELAAAVRMLPPTMQQYKSVLPFREAVLAWLDNIVASGGGPPITKERA